MACAAAMVVTDDDAVVRLSDGGVTVALGGVILNEIEHICHLFKVAVYRAVIRALKRPSVIAAYSDEEGGPFGCAPNPQWCDRNSCGVRG